MRIKIDKEARACYIQYKDKFKKPLKTKELNDLTYVDYDANGQLVGIEILTLPEIEYLGE